MSNTSEPPDQIGVHIQHCCSVHGCKYGYDTCPVMWGEYAQAHPCEDCGGKSDLIELLEAVTLIDIAGEIDKRPEIEAVAAALVAVRQAKAALGDCETALTEFLADVMPGGEYEIDGIGFLRAKWGAPRVQWDGEALRPAVVSAIADRLGIIAAAVETVVTEWTAAAGSAWKVTGLRALGIEPDEFSVKKRALPRIEIS